MSDTELPDFDRINVDKMANGLNDPIGASETVS